MPRPRQRAGGPCYHERALDDRDDSPPSTTPPPVPRQQPALLRTWGRTAVGLLVLAAIVGALVTIDLLSGSDSSLGALDNRSPEVGSPAPDFALRDAEGAVREMGDYRGKAVWLNFWATWCGPCRRELPTIQRLADEFRDDGLVVLAVNFRESAKQARSFWEELGLRLPILLDSNGDVVQQYRLRGFPDNFFIDRDGVLRAFDLGELDEEEMRERLAELGLR